MTHPHEGHVLRYVADRTVVYAITVIDRTAEPAVIGYDPHPLESSDPLHEVLFCATCGKQVDGLSIDAEMWRAEPDLVVPTIPIIRTTWLPKEE